MDPSLFNNPRLSDIKIKQIYKGVTREYYAHKAVLSCQSAFFMNAFTGHFKEASATTIEVHDDDPVFFEWVLRFMYTNQYDTTHLQENAKDVVEKALIPISIFTMADKYHIDALEKLAAQELRAIWAEIKDPEYKAVVAVVEAYYELCTRAASAIGASIVGNVRASGRKFMQTKKFGEMLEQYPVFGADMSLSLYWDGIFASKPVTCKLRTVYSTHEPSYTTCGCVFAIITNRKGQEDPSLHCPICGAPQGRLSKV
jgi:hypothetical protein